MKRCPLTWTTTLLLASALAVTSRAATAQTSSPTAAQTQAPLSLTFRTYLEDVARSNLGLAAQRANVPLAEAQVVLARIFPDPVVTAGIASWDLSGVGAQNNISAGVSIPFEWPTKRPARVAAARASLDVANAELDDFVRVLRANAATAYVDALLAQRVLLRRKQAYESIAKVLKANEERQREGAVAEMVVLQARIETRRYHGDVVAAEGELRASRAVVADQMGRRSPSSARAERDIAGVSGELRVAPKTFDPDALIAHALASRSDVRARQLGVRAANARVDLARANRGVDMAVNLGWVYYTQGRPGSAYDSPAYHTGNATLSVPLPLSHVLSGELQGARAAVQQAEAQRSAAELHATTEVRAALARYEAARDRLAEFDQALLADSDKLLEMARYSFEQGASRLIELLTAQRTWTETYIAYETALADHARALIALESAADAWDVAF